MGTQPIRWQYEALNIFGKETKATKREENIIKPWSTQYLWGKKEREANTIKQNLDHSVSLGKEKKDEEREEEANKIKTMGYSVSFWERKER